MRCRYPIDPPSAEALATAPLMDAWLVEQEERGDGAVLIGIVDGRRRTTNTLLAYDAAAGWARTWSGVWRLGEPLDAALNSLVCLGGEDQ